MAITVPRLSNARRRSAGGSTITVSTAGAGNVPTPSSSIAGARRASGNLNEAARQFVNKEIQRANEIAVQDASASLGQASLQAETAAKNKRGRDAAESPDIASDLFGKSVAAIGKTLSNGAQQRAFGAVVQARALELDRRIQTHTSSELLNYDRESTAAFIGNAREDAATHPSDPLVIARSLAMQRDAIRNAAARNGISDEGVKQALAQATSKTHAAVIKQLIETGQTAAAQEYAEEVKDQLSSDDISLIEKAKKEAEIELKERQEQLGKETFLRTLTGAENPVTFEELDALAAAEEIDRSTFDALRKRLVTVNNDPEKPLEDRSQRFFDVVERFNSLHGAKFDTKKRRFDRPAKSDFFGKNRLEDLKDFRNFVADSAWALKPDEERNFYLYTERNLSTAQSAKAGILESFLKTVVPVASDIARIAVSKLFELMEPSVTVEKTSEAADKLKNETIAASNLNRTRYTVGQTLTNANGLQAEVIGFDEGGNPILKWKR